MALRLVAICALIMANAVAGLAIPEEDLWAEDPAPPMATVLPPTGDTSYAPCSSLVLEARRMSEPKVKGEKCTKLSVCRAMAIMDQTAYNTKVEASNSELAKCGKKGHPAGGDAELAATCPASYDSPYKCAQTLVASGKGDQCAAIDPEKIASMAGATACGRLLSAAKKSDQGQYQGMSDWISKKAGPEIWSTAAYISYCTVEPSGLPVKFALSNCDFLPGKDDSFS